MTSPTQWHQWWWQWPNAMVSSTDYDGDDDNDAKIKNDDNDTISSTQWSWLYDESNEELYPMVIMIMEMTITGPRQWWWWWWQCRALPSDDGGEEEGGEGRPWWSLYKLSALLKPFSFSSKVFPINHRKELLGHFDERILSVLGLLPF